MRERILLFDISFSLISLSLSLIFLSPVFIFSLISYFFLSPFQNFFIRTRNVIRTALTNRGEDFSSLLFLSFFLFSLFLSFMIPFWNQIHSDWLSLIFFPSLILFIFLSFFQIKTRNPTTEINLVVLKWWSWFDWQFWEEQEREERNQTKNDWWWLLHYSEWILKKWNHSLQSNKESFKITVNLQIKSICFSWYN